MQKARTEEDLLTFWILVQGSPGWGQRDFLISRGWGPGGGFWERRTCAGAVHGALGGLFRRRWECPGRPEVSGGAGRGGEHLGGAGAVRGAEALEPGARQWAAAGSASRARAAVAPSRCLAKARRRARGRAATGAAAAVRASGWPWALSRCSHRARARRWPRRPRPTAPCAAARAPGSLSASRPPRLCGRACGTCLRCCGAGSRCGGSGTPPGPG